ncbi:redoxin domain-containing protein [Candidatus Sumerlaeota bacterium]|nr:redoxin domain-containing protein [Candidatus Sumerlaeota bacterium]
MRKRKEMSRWGATLTLRSAAFALGLAALQLQSIAAQPDIGEPAPDIKIFQWIPPEAGNALPIPGLKGKIIIIDFWATWCGPCVAAIPHLNKLVEKFGGKNVVFLAMTDEQPKPVRELLAKKPIKAFVVLDNAGETHKAFAINMIPQTFLMDEKGIIRWKGHPMQLKEAALEKFLKTRQIDPPEKIADSDDPIPEFCKAEREIKFPDGPPLGSLQVRRWGSLQYADFEDWGKAAGTVRLPAGTEVSLTLSCDGTANLATLESLPPDAIQQLTLCANSQADEDATHLTRLTGLRTLNLNTTKITDAGLAHIEPLTSLRVLSLNATQVSDAGLAHLGPLTALVLLDLGQTKVRGPGLAHIADLPQLNTLHLHSNEIGDEGLAPLKRMRSLRVLVLDGTVITDAGMTHLATLTDLERLTLMQTGIGDAGLAHLAGLTNLKSLNIRYTKVTDQGLASLAGMKKMQTLSVGGIAKSSPLTEAGLKVVENMPTLKTLVLDHCKPDPAWLKNLQAAHPDLGLLQYND